MCSKGRYLIIVMLLFHLVSEAQDKLNFQSVDSLSYRYYNLGNWDELIMIGKSALKSNIDYKFLRQRIGYGYFMQRNYIEARYQFEKALTFDNFDSFSLEYLYYSCLNAGKVGFSGFFAQKLDPGLRKSLSIVPTKLLESIDLEYNYKYARIVHRSNPQFYRLGMNSQLGYRLFLYQSVSNYKQIIEIQGTGNKKTVRIKQPEYYALLTYSASGSMQVKAGYHYINTVSDTSVNNGNFGLFAVAKDLNRFSFETYGSVLSFGKGLIKQAGVKTEFRFPGKSNFTLAGTFSEVIQHGSNRFIYNQKAGVKALGKVWIECNLTFGRLIDYNDYNGLYVYNTYDPITFRSGGTMILYLNKNITVWTNFSNERKEYFEDSLIHYYQFSYSGGIRWKI
jgi:hypothetical protein